MKIDAPRRDERRPARLMRRPRAERQRERRHRDGVRIVRVNDVRFQAADQPREPPRRRQIHFRPRRQRNQVEALGGALPQLAERMRDERRALADRSQTVDRQQHLVLAAPPGSGRIHVQREHFRVQSSEFRVILDF